MMHGIYVVQSGDTLSKIATRLGMSVTELADYNAEQGNEIEDINVIHVGDEILYPDSMANRMSPVKPTTALVTGPKTSGTAVAPAPVQAGFAQYLRDPKMLAILAGGVMLLGLITRKKSA